ncbi:hypothetical protein HEK616_40280 [Streptomyces nigrescens]|uniref:Uncharacterized protein n=1 Tax=Streptomyces nigrescens TaxID=1920 RepID=A0ABM7ZWD5_STRNI|nr:hypothetical protein HEK616_40280 [Streptomyces nigrescens]
MREARPVVRHPPRGRTEVDPVQPAVPAHALLSRLRPTPVGSRDLVGAMKKQILSTALAAATILFVLGVGVWRSY